MTYEILDRAPQLGDLIRTVKPMNCDSLMCRAGDYLLARLSTPAATEEAWHLVASGRWVVVREVAT